MRTVSTKQERSLLVRNNPAIERPGWLPTGLWPELTELSERHEAAVKGIAEARREAVALGKTYEKEDAERIEAYKTGTKAPKMTDPAEREQATADARAKIEAAEKNLVDVAAEAVILVQEKQDEWEDDLGRQVLEAKQKREEAERLLAEAKRTEGEVARTGRWVQRTARNMPGRQVAHSDLGIPEPPPEENVLTVRAA